MANEKKVGCSANKTILVDPNMFDGQSSTSNISVPLEDLNISVQLVTNKKARTVLSTDATTSKSLSESSHDLNVTFIEGAEINGKKVLTTKFTDLTTNFDTGGDGENLGITDIQIDFSTSYTPMITIQFVDLRGSAIFQNEENIKEGKNKYATFFQLPYPIFGLTIKGYYGQPVRYCLHMTKMVSKFNSQTGNFEITCNFVGYTYAMLSDMLLGYLKAIPKTKLGAEKYAKLQANNPKLLTILELITNINNINNNLQRLKADNPNSQQLEVGLKKMDQLSLITQVINTLGNDIDLTSGLESYPFVVSKVIDPVTTPYNPAQVSAAANGASFAPIYTYNSAGSGADTESAKIAKYNDDITKVIADYNDGGSDFAGYTLDVNVFLLGNVPSYKEVTPNMINPNGDLSNDPIRIAELKNKGFKDEDLYRTREEIYNHLVGVEKVGDGNSETKLNIYDLRLLYTKINEADAKIKIQQKKLEEALAQALKAEINKAIGFDTNIRNIVEIFTTAVEVWLEVLYDVSKAADANPNDKRSKQLEKFKDPNNYDYKNAAIGNSPNSGAKLESKFYPWPDYRKKTTDGFVETYLGKPGELAIPKNVDELDFIDDLLEAFLKTKEAEEDAAVKSLEATNNWPPVNPLDSRLFDETYPYRRIKGDASRTDLINLMLIRAMIFLGFSNNKLNSDEIKLMAKLEAEAVLRDTPNKNIKSTFSTLTPNDFITSKSTYDSLDTLIIKPLTIDSVGGYYYNYIYGDNATASDADSIKHKLLPINHTLDKEWGTDAVRTPVKLDESKSLADDGRLFLSNYKTKNVITDMKAFYGSTLTFPQQLVKLALTKPNDGAVYIKFIPKETYDSSLGNPIIGSSASETAIDYQILKSTTKSFPKDGTGVGYNILGGYYGQEYRKMKWGNDVEGLPFRYMFYSDGTPKEPAAWNCSNGLGKVRALSGPNGKTMTTSYDIREESLVFRVPTVSTDISSNVNGIPGVLEDTAPTHSVYGKNRVLGLSLNNGSKEIAYPYVNFNINCKTYRGDNTLFPISLFGSYLYNAQTSDYTKAFLFLHTFPWAGLVEDLNEQWFTLEDNRTILEMPAILNLLGNRAGMVSMPKLWPAFIGGLLWRMDTRDGASGGAGPEDPIIWTGSTGEFLVPLITDADHLPTRYQYLTPRQNGTKMGVNENGFADSPMCFSNQTILIGANYKEVDAALLSLPDQAKDEFKKQFYNFVDKEWITIKGQQEIFTGTGDQWVNAYSTAINSITNVGSFLYFNKSVMKGIYNKKDDAGNLAFDNYILMSPIPINEDRGKNIPKENFLATSNFFKNNYVLEIKDGSDAGNTMLSVFHDEVMMANMSYRIWKANDKNIFTTYLDVLSGDLDFGYFEHIFVEETDLNLYITTLIENLQPLEGGVNAQKKQAEQEIFGTADEDIIKLQLYRTCKHTYDKWIGGSKDDNIIFQCGSRNDLDAEIGKRYGNTTPKLIDSFRFVDRSFTDIGDKLIINPVPINNFIYRNPNSSFYELVSQILGDNYFNFIPLPSYINYKDDETLKSMFRPMEMYDVEAQKQLDAGPAFVCVYVGQSSMHLDSSNSDYPNDGFDIRCNADGGMMVLPEDFTTKNEAHENYVATFAVNYGQQNQNIFKDITLDQNEITETAESLMIMDDISKKGAENNRTLVGQNLYNVWAVRSYKAEIEMMGNAMVQPMMYFQLNNIPMFHGAYMIIKVKHSLKPNTMSTNFTGVRIRAPKTELMDVSSLYMSLLASLETIRATGGGNKGYGGSTGSFNLGENCGENKPPNIPGDVSNSTTFYDTKLLRDMIANVESGACEKCYNSYNHYDFNDKLYSVYGCGGKGGATYKPLEMTIAEIQAAQKDKTKMFAVGKYQLVNSPRSDGPHTFDAMVKALGLQPTDKFDETNQEKAGEWLILGKPGTVKRPNLKKYWEGDGNENDLVNAITDLALEFASFPSYHEPSGAKNGNRSQVIGYNSMQAAYGGEGGNASKSKYCAQDVAQVLIQTWANLNKKTPVFTYDKVVERSSNEESKKICNEGGAPQSFDISSTAVIIGDSSINTYAGAKDSLKENGVAIGFNCVGKTVPWLVSELTKDGVDKTYPNVRIIYVSIGTNDGYKPKQIKELNDLITKKYPNAKNKMVLPGSLGWGNNCKKVLGNNRCSGDVDRTKADQNTYYANFTALGWTYSYPATASAIMTDAEAHNPNADWTKQIIDIIRANQKNNATLLASKDPVVAASTYVPPAGVTPLPPPPPSFFNQGG
jgi:hypothetical protein